jgi:uncharacterized membrane protein
MQISMARAIVLLAGLSLLATTLGAHQTGQSQITTASYSSNADPILFLLSASPTSMSIIQGYSGWSTVDVSTLPGQSGSVNLNALASAGLTATLNTTTVSLPPSPATAILSLAVNSSTPPGVYTVVVNGTSGTSSHAVAITVTVLPAAAPSFNLISGPESLTIPAGTNGTDAVAVNSLNGFTGDVKLTATVSPAGPTATITPADITVPSNGTVYSTMMISTTPNTSGGNYTVIVQGSNGTISGSWIIEAFISTKPVDFNLSLGSTSLTIPAGTNDTSPVTVNSLNGFTGDVKLTATVSPAGPTATITPADVLVSSTGQPATATLLIVSSSSLAPGSYLVKVDATTGAISHDASLILIVIPGAPPSFSISASPASIVLQAGMEGSSVLTMISLNGFSGNVTLSLTVVIPNTNAPTVSFSPTMADLSTGQSATSTLTVSPTASTPSGSYIVLLQASSGTVSDSWTLQAFVATTALDFGTVATPASAAVAPGDSSTFNIALTSLTGFSGSVSLSACSCASPLVPERPMMTLSPGNVALVANGTANSTLTVTTGSTTPIGTYVIVVGARSGAVLHYFSVMLTVKAPPDFTLTPSASDLNFPSGSTGSDGILVTGLNGFTGTISFTSSPNPTTGLATSCPNVTVTAPTTTETSTCGFNSATPGTYSVTIIGAAGQHSAPHYAIIFVTVDQQKNSPTITTSLSTSTIKAGSSVTDSAMLTGATNNAGGTVTYLLYTGTSCTGTGVTVGSPVTVVDGIVPVSTAQTFNSSGLFSWEATYSGDAANNGATSQCETLTVTSAIDFTLSLSPTSLTIQQDHHGIAKVTLQSLSFTGKVHLQVTVSPTVREKLHVHIENRRLKLSSNGSSQTVLVISADDNTPTGTYNITVTAKSGPISHSIQLIVTVIREIGREHCKAGRDTQRQDRADTLEIAPSPLGAVDSVSVAKSLANLHCSAGGLRPLSARIP